MNPELKALLEELKSKTVQTSKKYDEISELIEQRTKGYISQEAFDNNVKEQKSKASELEANLDRIEKLLSRPPSGGGSEHKSIGQRFAQSEEFKGKTFASKDSFTLEMKDITLTPSQAIQSNPLGGSTRLEDIKGVVSAPLGMRNIMPIYTTGDAVVEIIKVLTENLNAGVAAENTPKQKSDATFGLVQNNTQYIPHYFQVSRQALNDSRQLASYIDNRLLEGVMRAEEAQIIGGSGVTPQLGGLLLPANSTAYSNVGLAAVVPAPTSLDHIRWAMRQMQAGVIANSYYNPSGLVIHPLDLAKLALLKDGVQRYLFSDPFNTDAIQRIWGVPVVQSASAPVGGAIVGDFRTQSGIWDQEEFKIEISTENQDNFIKNAVTIRGESRITCAFFDNRAFIRGITV